jgi:hypothetical protein
MGQGSVGERHADWGPEPAFQPETGALSGRPGQKPRGAHPYDPDDRDRDRPSELSPDDLGL